MGISWYGILGVAIACGMAVTRDTFLWLLSAIPNSDESTKLKKMMVKIKTNKNLFSYFRYKILIHYYPDEKYIFNVSNGKNA